MMPEEQKPYEVVPIKGMKPSKPVSPSEDKTAEPELESQLTGFETMMFSAFLQGQEGGQFHDWYKRNTLKVIFKQAMTEYGTICRNKAIEEAEECVLRNGFIENYHSVLISELNKLKKV